MRRRTIVIFVVSAILAGGSLAAATSRQPPATGTSVPHAPRRAVANPFLAAWHRIPATGTDGEAGSWGGAGAGPSVPGAPQTPHRPDAPDHGPHQAGWSDASPADGDGHLASYTDPWHPYDPCDIRAVACADPDGAGQGAGGLRQVFGSLTPRPLWDSLLPGWGGGLFGGIGGGVGGGAGTPGTLPDLAQLFTPALPGTGGDHHDGGTGTGPSYTAPAMLPPQPTVPAPVPLAPTLPLLLSGVGLLAIRRRA